MVSFVKKVKSCYKFSRNNDPFVIDYFFNKNYNLSLFEWVDVKDCKKLWEQTTAGWKNDNLWWFYGKWRHLNMIKKTVALNLTVAIVKNLTLNASFNALAKLGICDIRIFKG